MEYDSTRTRASYRQFVALVRSALDAAGRADVVLDRQWFDEDTPEHQLLVHVPVGPALTVPLALLDSFFLVTSDEDLQWHANEFALALANLKQAEKMLEKYARDVRTAAVAAIATARADGLDILLDGVGFKPTYAHHLTGRDWKDAALRVLAEIKVKRTSFFLRPEVTALIIEEPTDVPGELASILEEQRERQIRLVELDALGADLVVDSLTLDLLAAHNVDAVATLAEVWKRQRVNMTVEHLEREASLSLVGFEGTVEATLVLDEAIWNGRHLWLRDEAIASGNGGLAGKSLGDLVKHPVFTSRPIVSVEPRHLDHFTFDLSDHAYFDAESGRIWRKDRVGA